MATSGLGNYVGSTQARHAMRMQVSVQSDRGGSADGMMFELSMHGCRISSIDASTFRPGTQAILSIDGFSGMAAEVLRAHDSVVGLRFVKPLTKGFLAEILDSYRDPTLRLQPMFRFAT